MAAAVARPRHPARGPARALLLCGSAIVLFRSFRPTSDDSTGAFVGSIRDDRVVQRSRVVMHGKATALSKRKNYWERQNDDRTMVEFPSGRNVTKRYLREIGYKDGELTFKPGVGLGEELTVNVKNRLLGVLRWLPGEGNKGAMVVQVGKPFYKGDPMAMALDLGVKPGMIIKAVDGKDVLFENFDDLMTLIADRCMGETTKKNQVAGRAEPFSITFAQSKVPR